MKQLSIILILSVGLSSCAHSFVNTYEPVIDTQGIDQNAYVKDLRDCRQFAVREDPIAKAKKTALAGALAGALIGAAIGSAYGVVGQGAGFGALEGGAFGTVEGAADGLRAQTLIVNRCMAGRGYRVLY